MDITMLNRTLDIIDLCYGVSLLRIVFAVFRCLVNGQKLFAFLGTPQICAEKTIVSFMYKGQQDVVISFMIARYFEHISLESEPFFYFDYCMIECA
jgi:hypothetical protein